MSTPALTIRAYRPADEEAVLRLWAQCGLTRPWNDPAKDIRRKLAEQPELFGVMADGADIEIGRASCRERV